MPRVLGATTAASSIQHAELAQDQKRVIKSRRGRENCGKMIRLW